jgi:hypothetical protein
MSRIIAITWRTAGFYSFGGVLHQDEITKKYMGNFGLTSEEDIHYDAVVVMNRGFKLSYEEALVFFPDEMKTITQDEYKY